MGAYPQSAQMQQQQRQQYSGYAGAYQNQHATSEQANMPHMMDASIMPDSEYLQALDDYQPKFDRDILAKMLHEVGLNTPDQRVYSVISMILEKKLE